MSFWRESPLAMALAWALVHFLWEGTVIAVALAMLLRMGRAWPARWRYAAATAALFALPAAFAVTAALYWGPGRPQIIQFTGEAHSVGVASLSSGIAPAEGGWRGELVWLTPLWMLGVLAFYLRSLGGWVAAHRLLGPGSCAMAESWRKRLNLPCHIPLLESCRIDVPMVVGLLRPAILVPVGFTAGLAPAQVEAILLHELAHIRRHDPLVNLLQNYVEGLLFYHPAVWWISSVVRAEREHCCDDQVVAATGDAHGYAAALAALEFARVSHQPALAANGGSLVERIRRLLHSPAPQTSAAPVLQSIAILLLAAVAMAAWQSKPADSSPQSKAVPATPYEKWVNEDVAYIINDRERAAFQSLQTDEEREHFIQQFWERRDPSPGTTENEFKEEHYRRIGYANQHFALSVPGWKTDRGRVYIVYGPPDEIESHPTVTGSTPAYEVWFYKAAGGFPSWCFFAGSDFRLAPLGSALRATIPALKPPVPDVHEIPVR